MVTTGPVNPDLVYSLRRVTERAVQLHGGNGYIEDWPVARILRDAQVNTIWEGPDNILCLDVRRGIQKHLRKNGEAMGYEFRLLRAFAEDHGLVHEDLRPAQKTSISSITGTRWPVRMATRPSCGGVCRPRSGQRTRTGCGASSYGMPPCWRRVTAT